MAPAEPAVVQAGNQTITRPDRKYQLTARFENSEGFVEKASQTRKVLGSAVTDGKIKLTIRERQLFRIALLQIYLRAKPLLRLSEHVCAKIDAKEIYGGLCFMDLG